MMYHVTIISCCMIIFLKLARLCPPRLGTKEERTASQCRAPNLKKSWRNSVPFGVSKTSETINASFRDGRYGTHISSGIHLKCNAFSPSPPLAFQKNFMQGILGATPLCLMEASPASSRAIPCSSRSLHSRTRQGPMVEYVCRRNFVTVC